MKVLKGCAFIFLTIPLLVVVLFVFDRYHFGLDATQREMLKAYVPEARCGDADFEVLEQSDLVQDWTYVVLISGSSDCINSLRSALITRGAKPATDNFFASGLVLPGHEIPEYEGVAFDFKSVENSVIWTRDKT